MNRRPALTVRIGAQARAVLEREGWQPDLFSTLLGASGGPKWLVLARMDGVLARRFVHDRSRPLDMFGTSIGSFRHACLAQTDPAAALARFEKAYIASPEHVTAESRRILDIALGDGGAAEILANSRARAHIGTVRSRGLCAAQARSALALGLGMAAAANAVSRRTLAVAFERVVFHATEAPRFVFEDLPTVHVPLDADNLRDALAASGSIPLVMAPITDIAGAPPGVYRDGGITDYHFAFDFEAPTGLVLFPHFFDGIIPGWFDKVLRWRHGRGGLLERTVMVAPSPAFGDRAQPALRNRDPSPSCVRRLWREGSPRRTGRGRGRRAPPSRFQRCSCPSVRGCTSSAGRRR